jgi:DnaJ like chaperone protein
MSFGKWIGGGLGWALGGPIFGVIGFVVGAAFDGATNKSGNPQGAGYSSSKTTRGDFMASLIVLTAAVMKADGVVVRSELDFVKKFLTRSFGNDAAADAVKMLRDVLKKDIPVNEVSAQVGHHLDYSSRLQLLHYLFGIAGADGKTVLSEVQLIQQIAQGMGISTADFNSIKAMFYSDTHMAYSVLGLSPDASNEEIKKAYKKMAVQYHPDKVSYLGEDVQQDAKEKFQKINEAYENLKKQRGFA